MVFFISASWYVLVFMLILSCDFASCDMIEVLWDAIHNLLSHNMIISK